MDPAGQYLRRHALYEPLIPEEPAGDLQYILVIPAWKEPDLLRCLDSFTSADPPGYGSTEIIVVLNYPENADKQDRAMHAAQVHECHLWASELRRPRLRVHFLECPDLPLKFAGPGLARKIGMDEAVRRFVKCGNPKGIILSSDGDTTCNREYFRAISAHFMTEKTPDGCSVYFEHPLSGTEYESQIYEGICHYELHLRYYLQALRNTGHPNVYHTVGSAFAVSLPAYCRSGGMNRRKAGEDFYFLQKIIDLGNFSDCTEAMVIPSSRPSDRVPFGTGAAISACLEGSEITTFHPALFKSIRKLISALPELYKGIEPGAVFREDLTGNLLRKWLEEISFHAKLKEIRSNSASPAAFEKRFFQWFNMFRMMKFLNYGKEVHARVAVKEAAVSLLKDLGLYEGETSETSLLLKYRKMDRGFIRPR